jgi:isopenicillin-N N-acyltransferase-like protein
VGVQAGVHPLQVVDAGGDARTRGQVIGTALKDRIGAHLAAWRAMLTASAGGDVDAYLAAMLRETDFASAIRRNTPDLLEEVEATAAAAGVAPDTLFALQLLDEEWAYRVRRAAGRAPDKCSSLSIVTRDGPTWIGQNMDLGDYTDGHQVLLRIGAEGGRPEALVFSIAGMIGLMGVNAAGVGVCVNSLPQLPSAPEGVPVAFVLRRLLQSTSLDEAVEVMTTIPHATNQHYVIAEPGAVRSFEASAAAVTEYHPPDPTRVLHTNHPLSDAPAAPEAESARVNSVVRLKSLVARLQSGEPGLAEVQGALCAEDDPLHPVCRPRNAEGLLIGFTTGSLIAAVEPGRVDVWVSAGPPRERGYHRYTLADAERV